MYAFNENPELCIAQGRYISSEGEFVVFMFICDALENPLGDALVILRDGTSQFIRWNDDTDEMEEYDADTPDGYTSAVEAIKAPADTPEAREQQQTFLLSIGAVPPEV